LARLFDDGSSEYLEIDQAPATGKPFSMACWFRADAVSADMGLMWLGEREWAITYTCLQFGGDVVGDPVRVETRDAGGQTFTATTTGATVNTWHHALACLPADPGTASVYIDGGSKATAAADNVNMLEDRVSIGRYGDASPGKHFSGLIAEAAVWSAALTDAEGAILAAGYSPLFVRPQSLEAYWPLVRSSLTDRVGGYTLVASGTVVAAHPPMIYPAPRLLVPAAAGIAMPIFAMNGVHSVVFGGQVVR